MDPVRWENPLNGTIHMFHPETDVDELKAISELLQAYKHIKESYRRVVEEGLTTYAEIRPSGFNPATVLSIQDILDGLYRLVMDCLDTLEDATVGTEQQSWIVALRREIRYEMGLA